MMINFLLILVFLGLSHWNQPLCAAETGQITGQLADTHGQITYAGEVVVFLCDAKTGYPVHRQSKTSIQSQLKQLGFENFWYSVTDPKGLFEFKDVPVGQYRLVAQSWSGTKGLPKLPGGMPSSFVILHGVAENVEVKPGGRTVAFPRQLGNGVLTITNDPEEPHAFLLLSLKPTLGDAILGPQLWGDEFISQLVGVTLMEQSHVTICGLPDDRDIHVALFNYDNNPGVGAATFKAGQRQGKLRIVASWSNGHHEPPPELLALTDHLQAKNATLKDFLPAADQSGPIGNAEQTAVKFLLADPKREVEVAGLGKRRLIDVAAALSYAKLRAQFKK
jgi:hypothetical protein